MLSSYDQIWLARALIVVMLTNRVGIPRDNALMIAAIWAVYEFTRLQRRRRSGLEFDLDGDRYFGPGY